MLWQDGVVRRFVWISLALRFQKATAKRLERGRKCDVLLHLRVQDESFIKQVMIWLIKSNYFGY